MLCPISSTTLFSIRRLFSILRCLILTRFWAAALITSISASTKSKVRVGWQSHSIWDISILKSSNYDFPYWRYSLFSVLSNFQWPGRIVTNLSATLLMVGFNVSLRRWSRNQPLPTFSHFYKTFQIILLIIFSLRSTLVTAFTVSAKPSPFLIFSTTAQFRQNRLLATRLSILNL